MICTHACTRFCCPQVIYHFPYHDHLRRMFRRTDLVPHLLQETGDRPRGHVRNSRGWDIKVSQNPIINADHRHQALVGTTDGVPFFEDQRRGAWLFVFRHANLPDALSMSTANVYMPILSANEYWELDESANVLRRRIRGPKSLSPHLTIIADDMQGAYAGNCTSHPFLGAYIYH
jgi:hypothetical protein